MKKLFLIFIMLITPCFVFAAQNVYQFDSSDQEQRFNILTSELRCLVCQNQNLAESNAPLAADLRGQIYQKVQQGQSEKEIIDYLVTRYGNFILYRPPFDGSTLGLWLAPFLLLIVGVSYLLYYVRKKQRD